MTANVYLSAAVAHHAEQILADHHDDGEGWCAFCLLHFNIRVRTGACLPAWRATEFIRDYERQQTSQRRPPAPRPAGRPPNLGRVWPS